MVDEINEITDPKLWERIQQWLREWEIYERDRAAFADSPETVEWVRRTLAECAETERRRVEYESSPEGIAEDERLSAKIRALLSRYGLDSIEDFE